MAVRREGNNAIIELAGRLALGDPVEQFRAQWTEAVKDGAKIIVVNLSNVTMVDSSGIGTLIRCHSAVHSSGGKVKIVGANATVIHAFKVTRLDQVFEFHPDEQSALAARA